MTEPIQTKKDFSCGGIVWDQKKQELLLIFVENLSKARVWTFPKGHPEANENDQETALREVVEETGWRCEIDRPLWDTRYWYVRNGVRYHKTVRWFVMRPLTQVGPVHEGEVLDSKWCDLAEAKRLLAYDSDKELLKRFEQVL